MVTSSELLKQRRRDQRWDAFMAQVREAEKAKREWPPFPVLDDPEPEPKKDDGGGDVS